MRNLILVLALVMGTLLSFGHAEAKDAASPTWIQNLAPAQNARQLFIVAGVGKTTAWVSMHEKDAQGNWQQIMTTPGFIGKEGLGKTKEGDGKTPIGVFRFDKAMGIAPDPGCSLPYTQVDENYFWSGDPRQGMGYNRLVDIRDYPNLDKEASEHLVDYDPHYTYALNISYNSDCIVGVGSAIFLHCFGPMKPYTGGCVAIPENQMRLVMQRLDPQCVVIIDYLRNLSPETADSWRI